MKKRRIPSLLAAVALLLPLLGALTTAGPLTPASAAAFQGQLMTTFNMVFNQTYNGRATHYLYSVNGIIHETFDLPPAAAAWATPSNFYEEGWSRNSTAEVYTYSHSGQIRQTTDRMGIPPTATWATISSFEIDEDPGQAIRNPIFHYSVNGTDVLTTGAANEIPPNAMWAALVSFDTKWVRISNVQFTSYTLSRSLPSVVSFSISSDSGDPQYARVGDSLTLTLVTDRPIMTPILRMADRTLIAEGGGTTWQGGLYLFNYSVEDGPIPVSVEFYTEEGAPGPILTATTDGTALIHDKTAPSISYTLTPAGATKQDVTVQVTVSDAGSGVERTKWAEGSRDVSYFATGGNATDSFIASENGTYTLYARDRIGHESLQQVTVSNIDREAPTLELTPNTTELTSEDVTVTAKAVDNVAIGKLLWAEGARNADYFKAGNGTSFSDAFSVNVNGTYSVYVEDTAGNATLDSITISNLLRQAPSISLTPSPASLTNERVTVDIEARPVREDAGNSLAALRWAKGEYAAAFFATGGGQDALPTQNFEADENDRYSVYARDAVGNEAVSTIDISNIDREAPTVTLTPSTIAPTNENVTVAVSAADSGSGLESVRWSAEAFEPGTAWTSYEVVDDEFTVEINGTYTVIASDKAGNQTMTTLDITNIDREAPTLTLTPSITAPTNSDIAVAATAADNVAISKLLWAEGTRNAAYFEAGNGTSFTGSFPVTVNGTYSVYVEDTAGNTVLKSITISNLFRQEVTIALTPSSISLTNEPVTVDIEAHPEREGDGNPLIALRWASGERDGAFFAAGGGQDALAEQEFKANENGLYSVYARDTAGNEAISSIELSNIDREAPTLSLMPSTIEPTNKNVTIAVNAVDSGSGLESIRWSAEAFDPDSPWTSSEVVDGEFTAENNGTYTVIAADRAGNRTVRQVNVENIFPDEPTLTLVPETTEPIGGKVTVSVQTEAVGDGNAISTILWTAGEKEIGYFPEGQSVNITLSKQFNVQANGTYTVYVRDAAGNEIRKTIVIDNLRRTNAALASLIALNGEEVLTFSSAFDPERLEYALNVGQHVSAIKLKASAADTDAAITVNGNPLAGGESVSIPLTYGTNTIRVVVSAQLPSEQKSYTIQATRQSPSSSGGATGSPAGGATDDLSSAAFTVWLNGKPIKAALIETFSRSSDGRGIKELKLEDAAAITALAQQSGVNELRIGWSTQADPLTEAVRLQLSAKALSQLSMSNIRLTLDVGAVAYEWPTGNSIPSDSKLIVQLKTFQQPADAEQTLNRALKAGAGAHRAKLVGVPVEITANTGNSAGAEAAWLVLPLPDGLESTALRKLAVFLENGDGTSSTVPGTIRYDSKGRATGIAVRSGASARVSVLEAEPIEVMFAPYVSGYAAGSFGPQRAVTRAELAALLAKLTPADNDARTVSDGAAAFRDVPQAHWAAKAVEEAYAKGWMGGKSGGQFSPNDPLTRAELAVVLVRWREAQAAGLPRFADVASHWAASSIAAAEREGWINGFADGSFRPEQKVTRAEMVVLLNRVLGRPALPDGGSSWSDVPESHWAAPAIRSASQSFAALRYLSGEVELLGK